MKALMVTAALAISLNASAQIAPITPITYGDPRGIQFESHLESVVMEFDESVPRSAACDVEFKSYFDKFRVTATNILPPNLRHNFDDLTFKVGSAPAEQDTYGETFWKTHIVYLDVKLCQAEHHGEMASTVAHELGHLISFYTDPALIVDIDRMRNGHQHEVRESYYEAQANIFGSQIFFESGFSSRAALTQMDAKCKKGSGYKCEAAMYWRTWVYNRTDDPQYDSSNVAAIESAQGIN